MKWIALENPNQLLELRAESKNQPVVIFKHSTRCSISQTALSRLERNWKDDEMGSVKPYYLDLLAHRNVSNEIVELFEVEHQSPQVIILKNGEVVFHRSHFDIEITSIKHATLLTEPAKN